MTSPTWHGHDRYRDLPKLGVDPDFKSDWEPEDNGVRPDNRDPLAMVESDGMGNIIGKRPAIGLLDDYTELSAYITPESDGRDLMEYQRDLATAQVMAKSTKELSLRTVGL